MSVGRSAFKPFTLALIQLGNIGANKPDNLKHAHEMILKAASGGQGQQKKPDIIVLPVSRKESSNLHSQNFIRGL